MSEMDEKLQQVLSNPQVMQQIMSMAQSLNSQLPKQENPGMTEKESIQPKADPKPSKPQQKTEMDVSFFQRLSNIATQSGIDREQMALLKALSPYLSKDRVGRLEKAMRAAKLANLASTLLGQNGIRF